MELDPLAWPDVPRICFGPGDPASLDANVGWVQSRPHDMHGYVEGYRKAATALYAHASARPTSPDYLVFPLVFLWRQHLELALKDVISAGRELADEPWGFPSGHRLMDLWKVALPYITRCGDPSAPELAHVEANLREFERIDPGADGFRYPLNRDQTARSMPNVPNTVNLRVLQEGMEALANFFSGVRSELAARIDYVQQALADGRRG